MDKLHKNLCENLQKVNQFLDQLFCLNESSLNKYYMVSFLKMS